LDGLEDAELEVVAEGPIEREDASVELEIGALSLADF
jgi:hypothetical protein